MKRREVLRAIGAATLGTIAASSNAATSSHSRRRSTVDLTLGNSHFLSKTNSIATKDQRDIEALALRIVAMPVITKAKAQAAQRFRVLAQSSYPAEAWKNFDAKLDEWAFHYTLLAINSDPNYPKVMGSYFGPPHEWFGMKVPGNRGPGTIENADNNYSVIPVDGHARFVLHGKRSTPVIGDCPIYLDGDLSFGVLLGNLDWRDIKFERDGTFRVTVDPAPANGRSNHLQSTPDAKFLFIRDTRVDWKQVPNAYRVERLDPPTGKPMTTDEIAARAAIYIIDEVAKAYMFSEIVGRVDTNTVTPPMGSESFGGQPTQKSSRGRLKLEDDEAFVLTIGPGGAGYWGLMLYSHWMMSEDYWASTCSLNNTQSVPNKDGTFTCVFSSQDPGVHNWIDTRGLHEPFFMLRIQVLPRGVVPAGAGQTATGALVKLADLRNVLPAETQWITSDERRTQLAARAEDFKRRYIDS